MMMPVDIHPLTPYLVGIMSVCVLVHGLSPRISFRWPKYDGVMVGIRLMRIIGFPPTPEEPNGLRSSYWITIGVGLFIIEIHFFGRVPKKWRPRDEEDDIGPHDP